MRDDLGTSQPASRERRLQRPARHHGNGRLRDTTVAVRVPGPGLPGTGRALAGNVQAITVDRVPHREHLSAAVIVQIPIYQVYPTVVGNKEPHRSATIAIRIGNVTASALQAQSRPNQVDGQ